MALSLTLHELTITAHLLPKNIFQRTNKQTKGRYSGCLPVRSLSFMQTVTFAPARTKKQTEVSDLSRCSWRKALNRRPSCSSNLGGLCSALGASGKFFWKPKAAADVACPAGTGEASGPSELKRGWGEHSGPDTGHLPVSGRPAQWAPAAIGFMNLPSCPPLSAAFPG